MLLLLLHRSSLSYSLCNFAGKFTMILWQIENIKKKIKVLDDVKLSAGALRLVHLWFGFSGGESGEFFYLSGIRCVYTEAHERVP